MKRFAKWMTAGAAALALLWAGNAGWAKGSGGSTAAPGGEFIFRGGTPQDFLFALDEHYGVDWRSVADIPESLRDAHVPVLRISAESVETILSPYGPRGGAFGGGGGGGGGGGAFGGGRRGGITYTNGQMIIPGATTPVERELAALVTVYNQLGTAEVGDLQVVGSYAKPSLVIFATYQPRTQQAPPQELTVKAFPLKAMPADTWDKLAETVQQELTQLLDAEDRASGGGFGGRASGGFGGGGGNGGSGGVGGGARGNGFAVAVSNHARPQVKVSLHPETAMLVVMAPERYIEAAQSIVEAAMKNEGKEK